MTAEQPPLHGASTAERRERGLALADELLESGRGLSPLSGAAHARVKRRLVASTRRRAFRRVRRLRPMVIVSLCLVCGAAFGIALDRVVLKRGAGALIAPSDGGGRPVHSQAHSGRTAPKPPIAATEETIANSDEVSADLPPSHEAAPPTSSREPVATQQRQEYVVDRVGCPTKNRHCAEAQRLLLGAEARGEH